MDNLEIQAGYEQEEDKPIDDRKQRILSFAEEILKKRKLAVEHRAASGVERRWVEDEEAFNEGLEADHFHNQVTDYATGVAPVRKKEATRSKVTANIIRGRCETAEGRFVDVAFPVEGKNWCMETTPIPEMAGAMDDDSPAMQNGMPIVDDATGQQARMKDVAIDMKDRAEKAMELMEKQVEDQLAECDYNSEARKVIRSAIKLGTGVLKGPLVIKDVKKSWNRQDDGSGNIAYVIKMIEDHAPASRWTDIWNVYPSPDCGENVQKASYIWERGESSPRDLHSLIGVPGYDEEMIREVLEEEPKRLVVGETKRGYRAKTTELEKGSLYETWEYNGDVDKEDLLAMGCECPDTAPTYRACVLFVNDKPVKADLSLIDTGDLPYDFFVWSPVDGSPFGIGIPRQMYWWQRIIKGALRMMMDNAADSARAHLVISDQIQPVGGDWSGRMWEFIPGATIDDIRKAFQQFQVTNNQNQLQAIIELALRFVDLETVVPAIFQGEAQEVPETLGATNIMVNSANIAFRMRLKHWDDFVTRPHIRRYYDWNMQYGKDDKAKGDYKVVPIGATSLYEQDQHGQRLINLLRMGQHPAFAKVDWEKVGEQILRAWHIDAIKAPEQLEQDAQNQPQAPPNPQAEVATIRVQGEMQKAQLNQQSDMEELRFKAQQADMDRQHEAQMKMLERDMLILKLMNDKDISVDSIKAALAGKSMELSTQVKLAGASMAAKQVAETNMEPVGQAPPGEAFQK